MKVIVVETRRTKVCSNGFERQVVEHDEIKVPSWRQLRFGHSPSHRGIGAVNASTRKEKHKRRALFGGVPIK